jgi:hypothetical protein
VTRAQAKVWRRLRNVRDDFPEAFTEGRYNCIVHADRKRSMKIGYAAGKVDLHCFDDGCTTAEILDRLGLKWGDLYDDGPPADGRELEATYPYIDAAGNVLIEKLRYKPKHFRYRRIDVATGDELWMDRKGVPYTLYRLPEILEAIHGGERVFVVEGEAGVAAMESIGAAATCGWRTGEDWTRRPGYLEALKDADVTIVAKRTDAGRKHAQAVYSALLAYAKVELVEPVVLTEGADAETHVKAGFTTDDFAPLDPLESDATVPPPPAEAPKLAAELRILDRFAVAIRGCGVVGETATAATTYLTLTSRLLDRQASLIVKGHSSSGKSYTVEQTAKFFPPEAVIVMTGMSERALIYSPDEYSHRTLLLYEESALREGAEDNMTAYLVRSLLSEGRLEYPVTIKDKDGGFTTKTIVKEGPTNLVMTTTKVAVHAENETRMLSITTDDSREQTARVFAALADETGSDVDLDEWVQLQRWLANAEHRVTIPYAARLAELVPPVAVRLRRDFGTLLALIRAHAILHQQTRQRDAAGRIIATTDDYEQVRALVEDVIAAGVGETVSPTVRSTVEAVAALTTAPGGEEPRYPDGVNARYVADWLELDKSAARRRLWSAAAGGYVFNAEDQKFKPGRWKLGEPLPGGTRLLPVESALATAPEPETAGQDDGDLFGGTVAGESGGQENPGRWSR